MAISDLHYTDDSDVALILRTRSGDTDAFGVLHERHSGSARALAWQMSRSAADADDLVSEGFARVLAALTRGSGPESAFRPYLLSTIRRLAYDRTKRERRETPVEYDVDQGTVATDVAVENFERDAAAAAFASLPERWRMVLWHTEVEGESPAEVAPLLGMNANAVAALAYRAREGLRQAYLTHHATRGGSHRECRHVEDRLAAYVREGLSPAQTARVGDHLEWCEECQAAYVELLSVNTSMRSILAPIVLGAAGTAYLASRAAASASVPGVRSLRGRLARQPQRVRYAAGAVAAVAAVVLCVTGIAAARNRLVRPATEVGAPPVTAAKASAGPGRATASVGRAPTPSSADPAPVGPTSSVPVSVLDATVDQTAPPGPAAVTDRPASAPRVPLVAPARPAVPVPPAPPAPPTSVPPTSVPPTTAATTTSPVTDPPPTTAPPTTAPIASGTTPRPGQVAPPTTRPSRPIPVPTIVAPPDTVPDTTAPDTTTTTSTTTTTTTVPPEPSELALTISSAGNLVAGRPGVVVAAVANRGAGAARDVTLLLDLGPLAARGLPRGTDGATSSSGWQCTLPTSSTLRCTASDVASGASRSLYVPVRVPSGTSSAPVQGSLTGTGDAAAADATVTTAMPVRSSGMAARFATIEHGDILAAGNGLMTCPDSSTGCVDARQGHGSRLDDGDHDMVAIDVDSDPATTNSSSASVACSGSDVMDATLYWGADLTPGAHGQAPADPGAAGHAVVRTPGGARVEVDAERVDHVGSHYQAVVDATALVRAGGAGTWTVGGIQLATGKGNYGGWSLVVACEQPAAPLRSLVIIDGLGHVSSGSGVTLDVGGFSVPTSGSAAATVTAVTYEGDAGLTGDQLTVAGRQVADGLNPLGNTFNSTLSDLGSRAAGGQPHDANLFGFDVDRFDVSGALAPGATSTALDLATANDEFFPGVVAFAIDQ